MVSLTQLAVRCAAALPGGGHLLRRASDDASDDAAVIFMLHRVLPDPSQCYDPAMVVSLAAFEEFVAWVAEHYEVLPLEELHGYLGRRRSSGAKAKPTCALTFDDGWLDTFTQAFPVLQQWRAPATVFLPLHFIGTDRRFWQERLYFHLRRLEAESDGLEALQTVGGAFPWCPELQAADLSFARLHALLARRSSPEAEAFVERLGAEAGRSLELIGRVFMNWDEVRTMHEAGIRFGSRTMNHTRLSYAAPTVAAAELRRSRQALSAQLDTEVQAFSYPWGGVSPFTPAQAREAGYGCAVTTQAGLARASSDPWQLPRIALSNAQLGWRPAAPAPRFAPATLQMHLARARAQVPRPPTALLTPDPGEGAGRLRIGFVVDNPQPWADVPQGHPGGSESQLRHLIEALDPEFFASELYFLQTPAEGLPTRLPWPCFAGTPAGSGRIATIAGLRRLLRQRRPAMVQTMFQDGAFLGAPAAWLAGAPAILCARPNAGHWKWRDRCSLRAIRRMADAWQTNSAHVAGLLQTEARIPTQAIDILPHWIDLTRFDPASAATRQAARQDLGLSQETLLVVCVANDQDAQELVPLVAAAATVCERLPMAQFVLVGKGLERGALASAICARQLESRVHLADASDQAPRYLAAADIGVLTSSSEGCSNAALEHMAAGLPTVLSDIPANRALTNAGLFPAGDAAALAAALLKLAADPALRAEQGRANRRYAEQYGGDAFIQHVQGHYLRMAEMAQPRRQSWKPLSGKRKTLRTSGALTPGILTSGVLSGVQRPQPPRIGPPPTPETWPTPIVGLGDQNAAQGLDGPPHSAA